MDRRHGAREDVIDFRLWDMGGQKSYQHTHQIFLTVSAIYLVVTLPRDGGGVQELDEQRTRLPTQAIGGSTDR